MASADPWNDTRRIESWAGEIRVNLIRLAAILAFYAHHLANVYLFRDDPTITGRFHAAVTALVMAWSSAVLVLYYCLSRRWVPPALKYVATAWDLLLVTALLMVVAATGEAKSWLAVLYLLVIATAPLRLDLPLVYFATLGSMAGYLFYIGYARYQLDLESPNRTPRTDQVIFLLALGAAGLLAGQMVRQARRLVYGYPVRVEQADAGTAAPPASA